MEGIVSHTGIFPAKIDFKEVTQVFWVEDSQRQTEIGHMQLPTLYAKNKRAVINASVPFTITDEEAFGRFSGNLITSSNFTWRLVSAGLHVQALKFPTATGIKFDKMITMNGFNSFDHNVVLRDFQLPRDNPAGGIDFVAVTELYNPSPFSIDLGTVLFGLSYKNVSLGIGTGLETKIVPENNTITLKGTLQKQSDPSDLTVVSELFTRYLNGETSSVVATGQSTRQADGTIISWLSEGLQDLNLDVPFKAFQPIDPIRSIKIGDLALQFDKNQPWTPAAESRTVQASLQLPFGFSLSISEIQNNFVISKDGSDVAGLSTPLGASTSSVSVLSSTNTVGTINISITDTRLSCPDTQHGAFSTFNRELTTSKTSEFRLVGQSRAIAKMNIGEITLDPIKVNVSTSMSGLQGLKGMTTIHGVDVTGGTSSGITLAIDVSIYNPSNLKLSTGDLSLQLSRDGTLLGTTLMPNLTLNMGNNTVKATSNFEANNSPQGQQTLDDFVGKKDVQLSISGYDGSTQVASLVEAFKALSLDVTLPALKSDLLNSAALKILPTTGKENNISYVSVKLANPFSAELRITKVSSSVSAFGIQLGTIDQDVNFRAAPKSTTSSPDLNLNMNFDPAALFTVTRRLASEARLDVAPLDKIVQLGGYEYLQSSKREEIALDRRQASLFKGFDLPTFVKTAFKQLKSDVKLTVGLSIGEYQTQIHLAQDSVATATDDSLELILPILAGPIVQRIVGGSTLSLDTVLIKDPRQTSFGTQLKGDIRNAGPFDATISFPQGLTINWNGKPIGRVAMSDVQVVGDVGAKLDVESQFEVADVGYLAEFTKTLLTEESFEWEIYGQNLTVKALGISVSGIELPPRRVSLKGFNGLKDAVKIHSFDLPANDPAGGIHLTIQATTINPSQVGIELSSIGFNTEYNGIMIAPVASTGELTLAPLSTSQLSLAGRLIPQQSSEGLAAVSDVFNNFLHGKDSDVVVHGASAGSLDVTWLNDGIKVLQVATVLPNQGVLDIIKSISLNEMTLMFSTQDAYRPLTSSKSTDAAFTIPFGFPLEIASLQQTIALGYQGADFAKLSIPKGSVSTNVQARTIHLTFQNVPLQALDNHSVFENFLAATTITSSQTLRLSGSADADANTAVGMLSLKDIEFSVESSIAGLQGLNARPASVANLDVNHGYPDYLLIKVDSALFNPSNLTIGTGDASFRLEFEGQAIGSANLANLVIVPGNQNYSTDVHFAPQGGAVSAGRDLLQNFLQGVDSETSIAGSRSSTPIQSLQEALSEIRLSPVAIPSIHQNLIKSTSLVFPVDIVQTGVASATFILENPFTASVNLLRVGATATYQGLTLGNIPNVDISSRPIHADGHSSVTSPPLPLKFNLEPVNIIDLLLLNSKANGVDLGPLVPLFQFIMDNPDYKPPVQTFVNTQQPTCISGRQFDVFGAILKALENLKVDLAVDSRVSLDDYPTDLTFSQKGVPAITDETSLYLIGAVAGPIAQHLVDGAVLNFQTASIKNIAEDGFDLSLKGSLTDTGPLDALITFTEPVTVTWNGKNIAQISLPPVCAAANAGVPNYETNARLTITDAGSFTDFATFMLHNPSFDWTISTPKLRLTALGTIFDSVALSKTISFKAFNGLPGVTIGNFQLPSDDPAGGIHIETDANIPSPAQIGIELGTTTFMSYYKNTQIGPLSTSDLVLVANAQTKVHLSGRILPQTSDNLDIVGQLFSGYLSGANQTLETRGDSVVPPGAASPVQWLSNAFKTLSLDVILPGEKLQVIQAIELNDLEVVMKSQDQTFSPPTSSKNTVAKYKNPFGFSLQVIESGQTIILGALGTEMAKLVIPRMPANGGVSTGNVVDLVISFENIPLQSLNNDAFALLFAAVTLTSDIDADLGGQADVLAKTAIGNVPISGIPIAVTSHLKGINDFGRVADLSNVSVTGSGGSGGSEYIVAPLTTTLQNPSNVSLDTVDISLPVTYKGVGIGHAAIKEFNLVPGSNAIATEFHYQPADANDTVAQSFLTDYIQTGNQLDLSILGDLSATPFASLAPALSGIELTSHLIGLNQPNLITHVNVYISLESLETNLVSTEFTLFNPLPTTLVVEFVQADAGVEGEIYAQFSQGFTSFVISPGATVSSGKFANVLLPKGALASLDIVPLGYLDIKAAATARVGEGGYKVPYLQLSQDHVPTDYTLDLTLSNKAKAMSSGAVSFSKKPTSSSHSVVSSHSAQASSVSTDSTSDDVKITTSAVVPTGTLDRPIKSVEAPTSAAMVSSLRAVSTPGSSALSR
ncbi:hypothetical protein CPB83DRAFT_790385 [Crepidotus variabilis]|uniref:Uncharacterized protein n=1 Tax=Crepidotus variabilis TaxID=179855 RepID=A0A9P6JR13_9AGAR|nr:hypothetical protein CPB83DRAFT_790385 [Crepidotus variabilis]